MSRETKEEYDKRLYGYIENYTRKIGIPPTLDMMLENVEGITSKSTLHIHLQEMVSKGLLTQKNPNKYYYPTSIDCAEVSVPISLLKSACIKLTEDEGNSELVGAIYKYLK